MNGFMIVWFSWSILKPKIQLKITTFLLSQLTSYCTQLLDFVEERRLRLYYISIMYYVHIALCIHTVQV
jgi:hypothetical protein